MEQAHVFIMWPGTRSHAVAAALKGWLPRVIQTIDTFVSSVGITPGDQWFSTIADSLRDSAMGIMCVTPENRQSPWLHFEAGAICMAADQRVGDRRRRAVPYLLDMVEVELEQPLAALQAVAADLSGTKALVRAVNAIAPSAVQDVDEVVERWWPDLAEKLAAAEQLEVEAVVRRTERSMLEELLAASRMHTSLLGADFTPTLDEMRRVCNMTDQQLLAVIRNDVFDPPMAGVAKWGGYVFLVRSELEHRRQQPERERQRALDEAQLLLVVGESFHRWLSEQNLVFPTREAYREYCDQTGCDVPYPEAGVFAEPGEASE